jgi:polar amino acid transport system permease protein
MTLLILYYGLQMLLVKGSEFGITDIQISPFTAGVIALSLVAAAYSSENFLAALRNLDRGQIEAARSFGMKRMQVFVRIVIPQVLRIALPGLSNNCMNILKDTSLVSIIALEDLMRKSYLAAGNTKQPIIFFACTCLIYLVMSGILLVIFSHAERHFNRGVVRYV